METVVTWLQAQTEQNKKGFIFITVSLHNRRHNSVDIMTRLDD
jgi:hypothetical protein